MFFCEILLLIEIIMIYPTAFDKDKNTYRKDYWNFESEALKPLTNFLKEFLIVYF